jgi:3-oxoacyl-[acyl-carrier protein] reductase
MSSAFDLSGRVALVTGAGSLTGIGFATARLLSQMGAALIITSTTDRIDDRVSELRASGADVVGRVGDLTDPSTAPMLVDSAIARWERLDVVVQNAGMTSVSNPHTTSVIEEMDFETWQTSIARNLDTTFLVAKACLPVMTAASWGRLVLVSSLTGPVMATRGEPAYAAAKSGMVGLTRALAVDVAAHGITVNSVAPGWVETGSQTDHEYDQGLRTPIGRSATPDEVASAICWLASSGASYVTGQCLVIDGGNSIAEERA